MKKIYVNEIKAGDYVDDIFVLAEKNISQKKDGNSYLNLTVSDKTGTLKGVMWDNIEALAKDMNSGEYVTVKGTVSEYRGNPQLVVKHISPCTSENINPTDFLPASSRDVDGMFLRLTQLTETINTGYIKLLLRTFFKDQDFVTKFKTAPAAKKMHHAYLGGLLEHSLSMALLAEKIAGHYSGVDRDMLVAGAILHDNGKTRELEYDVKIDYSDEGRFLSHVVIGVLMLREKIQMVQDFPLESEHLLEHMMISHHGSREFGSPEPPKTIEAVLLNYIDEIDARVNGIREFVEAEDSGENWTSYHRLLERHFYTKTHHEK